MSPRPASLDAIFKAYDIRGVYPDQLDETIARRVGDAFVAFTGARRVLVGRDMRPSSEPLVDRVHRRRDRSPAPTSSTSAWRRPTSSTSRPGTSTRPARCSPPATTRRSTTASSCAAPAPRPSAEQTGLTEIKATLVADGHLARRGTPRHGRAPATCSRRSSRHVRSFVDVDALAGHSRSSPTPPTAWAGSSSPRCSPGCRSSSTILYGELDGTFPNHPADPIQPENLGTCSARVLDPAPTSAWRSTATPTGCSSSTTRPSRCPGRSRRRSSRRRCSTAPARPEDRSCTTSSARRRSPRSIREHGGMPVRTRVGHSFIKAVMAETGAVFGGEHSGALLLPRQLPGRLRHHRRARRARGARPQRGARSRSCASPFERYVRVGRDQHRASTTRPRSSSGRRGTTPAPPRTGSTG